MDHFNINELVRRVTEEVYRQLGMSPSAEGGLNKYIDHTLLKPDATTEQVKKICDEAKQYQFASVCVNPSFIGFVAKELAGTGVAPCVVVGFPLGATPPEVKAAETKTCIDLGAKEVDMVINIGAVKSGDWDLVKRDVEAVVNAARGRALTKVILETCFLTDEEKVRACTICKLVGADFVKTSTGFGSGGATVEDVRLMRATVGDGMGVKASGGVKEAETARAMIAAGANRLGTSSGIAIVTGGCSGSGCGDCAMRKAVTVKDNY